MNILCKNHNDDKKKLFMNENKKHNCAGKKI